MPSIVKVRVSSVEHTTITSKAGKDLNYIVLKGFDEGANKGFKKQFFATKNDGTPTKSAMTADSLSPNDWVEITLDDSSWQNVQSMRTIGAPSGATAPDQAAYQEKAASRPAKGGGKTFRTVAQLNREVALSQSVRLVVGKAVKIKDMISVATKLEDFLVNGVGVPETKTETPPPAEPEIPETPVTPSDDDIPF